MKYVYTIVGTAVLLGATIWSNVWAWGAFSSDPTTLRVAAAAVLVAAGAGFWFAGLAIYCFIWGDNDDDGDHDGYDWEDG